MHHHTSASMFATSCSSPPTARPLAPMRDLELAGMTRTAKLVAIAVFLVQALFFTFIALHRFVDWDEGYYALASRLITMHKTPYVDFLFCQGPLLPYVYALWLRCFGISWIAARTFSALLTTLLGILLYQHVCRQTRSWIPGVLAVVLFASSALAFAWLPLIKTFSLAGLFLFAAYVAITWSPKTSQPWLMGLAGLLLGFSIDSRLYLVLLVPLFLWWIVRACAIRPRLVPILWFLGGCAIALVPCLWLFLRSPDRFLFNTLGFHAIRTDAGLIGMWRDKLAMVLMLFLGGKEGNGIQNSILIFISLGFVGSVREHKAVLFAFEIAAAIAFISILPTPVYFQYFVLCIPFLVVSAVCAVSELAANLEARRERLLAGVACAVILCIYVGASVKDFRHYVGRTAEIPGGERLPRLMEVSHAIDELASPGEMVASYWPAHIFESKAIPFPGFEGGYGFIVADRLTAEQRARYHIVSHADVDRDYAAHLPRIVVLGYENYRGKSPWRDSVKASLHAHGYTVVRTIGDTSIYVCCSTP